MFFERFRKWRWGMTALSENHLFATLSLHRHPWRTLSSDMLYSKTACPKQHGQTNKATRERKKCKHSLIFVLLQFSSKLCLPKIVKKVNTQKVKPSQTNPPFTCHFCFSSTSTVTVMALARGHTVYFTHTPFPQNSSTHTSPLYIALTHMLTHNFFKQKHDLQITHNFPCENTRQLTFTYDMIVIHAVSRHINPLCPLNGRIPLLLRLQSQKTPHVFIKFHFFNFFNFF